MNIRTNKERKFVKTRKFKIKCKHNTIKEMGVTTIMRYLQGVQDYAAPKYRVLCTTSLNDLPAKDCEHFFKEQLLRIVCRRM